MIFDLRTDWNPAGSAINMTGFSEPALLLISAILLILAIVLIAIVIRLVRQQRESRLTERVLREDISHLSQDFLVSWNAAKQFSQPFKRSNRDTRN